MATIANKFKELNIAHREALKHDPNAVVGEDITNSYQQLPQDTLLREKAIDSMMSAFRIDESGIVRTSRIINAGEYFFLLVGIMCTTNGTGGNVANRQNYAWINKAIPLPNYVTVLPDTTFTAANQYLSYDKYFFSAAWGSRHTNNCLLLEDQCAVLFENAVGPGVPLVLCSRHQQWGKLHQVASLVGFVTRQQGKLLKSGEPDASKSYTTMSNTLLSVIRKTSSFDNLCNNYFDKKFELASKSEADFCMACCLLCVRNLDTDSHVLLSYTKGDMVSYESVPFPLNHLLFSAVRQEFCRDLTALKPTYGLSHVAEKLYGERQLMVILCPFSC